MKSIFQVTTLALAIILSGGTAFAQQSVQKTTKAPVRHAVTKTTTAQAKKPAVATTVAKPQPQTQSAPTPGPAPVIAQQTEARPQPVTHSSPVRSHAAASSHRPVYLNAGVGVATYYGGGFPLGVSVEAGLKNNFSVGGSVDFIRYNYGYYSGAYTFVLGAARASYHLGEALGVQNDNFDPYIGASLGFRYANYRDSYGYSYSDYGSSYNSGLWLGIHVGARYFFSPKVGGFAEVGYGVSALKLGVTAKF